MEFLRHCIRREEIYNKDVLEVGSQDINGSPREVIAPLGPRTYLGVDFGPGNGVDLVLDARALVSHFGRSTFDVVVSTEMLEHAEDWKTSITQMKEVLRPGGVLVLSARGPGFPYHGFPHDYWRYTVNDFKAIFSDMKIEVCKDDTAPGVLFKGVKTEETGHADLSKLAIEPIVVPPEMKQVDGSVDILVANWNTLPWLRLLVSQIRRFHPRIPFNIFIWDNASTDGSGDWLKKENITHYASSVTKSHSESLHTAVSMTKSPYIAFIDVDSVPIQWWWLDQAIGLLQEDKVGVVGLGSRLAGEHHRRFVHPSFCVFRRELYERLNLNPHIVHDFHDKKTAFDVGETMCAHVEDAGYLLRFVGETHLDIARRDSWENRVVHCGSSTPVMAEKRTDLPFLDMVNQVVGWHRSLLTKLGIWEEFQAYAGETVSKNSQCARYLVDGLTKGNLA
jgi:SAM-dependent methyltransferase